MLLLVFSAHMTHMNDNHISGEDVNKAAHELGFHCMLSWQPEVFLLRSADTSSITIGIGRFEEPPLVIITTLVE
jgi:hypothetical protein